MRRPAPIKWDQPLRTPTFEVENMYCSGCPRDVMITIGHEVIEAPMSRRARYFEHLAYRHIDCTFVPLRPGLVLTNPERPLLESELPLFQKNDWRFVDAPESVSTNDEMPAFCQSSKWLSMNALSLSPNTVVVEAGEKPLIKKVKELGFRVIDLPFRDVFEFGGSLHYATWDVRRRGNCESYFHSLD